MKQKRLNLFQQLMDEHIHLPGVPQMIVTRGWAYQWLKKLGYLEGQTGFGSLDYMVFSARPTDEPLADLGEWHGFLDAVEQDLRSYQ